MGSDITVEKTTEPFTGASDEAPQSQQASIAQSVVSKHNDDHPPASIAAGGTTIEKTNELFTGVSEGPSQSQQVSVTQDAWLIMQAQITMKHRFAKEQSEALQKVDE